MTPDKPDALDYEAIANVFCASRDLSPKDAGELASHFRSVAEAAREQYFDGREDWPWVRQKLDEARKQGYQEGIEAVAKVVERIMRERGAQVGPCSDAGGNTDALVGKFSEAQRILGAIRALAPPIPEEKEPKP
jgi:uncharacterized protein